MSGFQLLLLIFLSLPLSLMAQNGVAPRDLWCVAKNDADDQSLQAAIDWACGPGGANCGPIQQGGSCYDPNDIQSMASWAFNDYYLKNGLTDDACFFSNTAALISLNPSHDKCTFPSSLSVKNGSNGSSSSSTTTTTTATTTFGVGPNSADLNGSRKNGGNWVLWLIITSHLFVMFVHLSVVP